MKKVKYYLVILLHVLVVNSFTSCSDFLDKSPDDMLTIEMIFNDKVRTEDWLAGIYSNIPDPYWEISAQKIGYDALGDDFVPSPGLEKFGWSVIGLQTGNWSPSTNWDPNYWVQLPKRIRSAYIFIENVKPNAAQLVTQEEVDLMKAEAKALIAYYVGLMMETYGAVPFNQAILSSTSSDEELMMGQKPYDELVDYIDKELAEAAAILPPQYTESRKFGRFTSIMCLAIRARALLFAASPLVNGNPEYKGHVNDKGIELFNSTYDPKKWERATKACKELIDAAHAAGHKLYYEYNEDGSIDPFLSYQNMIQRRPVDGNKEALFVRPDCNHNDWDKFAQPRGTGGNGNYGVGQTLVDAFFMKNGLPAIVGYNPDKSPVINEASGYTEKGFSTETELRKTKWIESKGNKGQSMNPITLEGTYNMYCNREPRFYVSVLYNRAWFRRENRTTLFMFNEPDGGPTHDAPQNGYLVRKKVNPDADPRNGIYPYRPGILYRLGEAYLNYAEALNESDPGNPDIIKYVNLIRERGGIPLYGNNAGEIPAPSGKEAVRELVRRERRVELNCESGIRYHDIRRWKIGEETLDGNFQGMNFNGTKISDDVKDPQAYFTRKDYHKRVFTKKNYWFPVPQGEMDKNPNLVQNPFW